MPDPSPAERAVLVERLNLYPEGEAPREAAALIEADGERLEELETAVCADGNAAVDVLIQQRDKLAAALRDQVAVAGPDCMCRICCRSRAALAALPEPTPK